MHPPAKLFLLALVTGVFSVHAQTAPAKPAASARLDLFAEQGVSALGNAEIPIGAGNVERMNWVPAADRVGSYTVHFPITHLAWRECAFRIVPEGSGPLTLSLMGPWEEASQGVVYRQEVLWDALQVTGAIVIGNSSQKWPARVWHNEPLRLRLNVTAKMPVTVLAKARAVTPSDYHEMRRFTGRNTRRIERRRKPERHREHPSLRRVHQ